MQARRTDSVEVHAGSFTTRLDVPAPGIVRVRRFPAGATPPESGLNRYGFYFEAAAPAAASVERSSQAVAVRTGAGGVEAALDSGRVTVFSGRRGVVFREADSSGVSPAGAEMAFCVPEALRFFGLGDQTRERIEHRGAQGDLWVRNVRSYIPIPVVFTDAGTGLLINTTRRVVYDLAGAAADTVRFTVPGGAWDLYFFLDDSLAGQIERYTFLTGRPFLPPKWAFGLWFISRTQADAREFLEDCRGFRTHGIPCDAISLEPGWMAVNYDFSTKKQWHPERFPIPSYAPAGRHNFLPAARRMGFKPGLWLCCDYDFSWEEERRLRRRAGFENADSAAGGGGFAEGCEQDEHLEGIRRMDGQTVPDEPWFEHLKKFVDQGVCYFKQDGANQVLSHPDRLYANGMRDAEMHNLYPLLYSRQMAEGFAEHTGRRPFGFTVAGWSGLQHYTGTWTGDTGGEEGPLGACLNCSLSGHNMTTVDMEVTTPEGIHFGFFLPWAQLDSWNYWRHPWYQGERLERIFRDYARLRYRLIPYLYSCAWEAANTGLPLLRPMPLAFPEDAAGPGLMRQYMLGPFLLVGAFTRELHLPAGGWYDFWSGRFQAGPADIRVEVPEDRGGPLFVPAGALLLMGPVMDYVGQRPEDELEIRVYPGADGRFTLYEDDGETFAWREGARRTTEFRLESGAAGGVLRIEPAQGTFPGACGVRKLELAFCCGDRRVGGVRWNGRELEARTVRDERGKEEVRVVLGQVPVDQAVVLEFRLD